MSSDKKNLDKSTIGKVKGPLGLQGNQYWDDPLSHKSDIWLERLFAEEVGIVIDAPTTVILDKHSRPNSVFFDLDTCFCSWVYYDF